MTKEEVLSILYSERSRLQDKYNMPGWTIQVVVATMGVLIFHIVNILIDYQIDFNYSVGICFVLFDLYYLFFYLRNYCIRKKPVIVNYTNTFLAAAIFSVVYFSIQIVWFTCSKVDLCIDKFHYIVVVLALSILILNHILLIYLCLFIKSGLKNSKNDWFSFIYPLSCCIIISYIIFFFINQHSVVNLKESVSLGLYCFALLFLFDHLIKEERELLTHIDLLIDRALYDDVENYDVILDELEMVTVGVELERALFKENFYNTDYYINNIKKEFDSIYKILLEETNWYDAVNKTGFCLFKVKEQIESMNRIPKYIKQMIDIAYGNKRQVENHKLLNLMNDIEGLISFYDCVNSKFATCDDFFDFKDFFIKEYVSSQSNKENNLKYR